MFAEISGGFRDEFSQSTQATLNDLAAVARRCSDFEYQLRRGVPLLPGQKAYEREIAIGRAVFEYASRHGD